MYLSDGFSLDRAMRGGLDSSVILHFANDSGAKY